MVYADVSVHAAVEIRGQIEANLHIHVNDQIRLIRDGSCVLRIKIILVLAVSGTYLRQALIQQALLTYSNSKQNRST